jgi:hypothetical protein
MGWRSNAYLNMSQLFSTDLLAQKGHGSIKVSDGFLGLREQRLQSERISNRFQSHEVLWKMTDQTYHSKSAILGRLLQTWNTEHKPYMLSGQELWEVLAD